MKKLLIVSIILMVLIGFTGIASAKELVLVEKNSQTWNEIEGASVTLIYNDIDDKFEYTLTGTLPTDDKYSLIYYKDVSNQWGNIGAVLVNGITNEDLVNGISGKIEDLKTIPKINDLNYPDGAKLWLIPSTQINEAGTKMTTWTPENYLFERNLIEYGHKDDKGKDPKVNLRYDGHKVKGNNPIVVIGETLTIKWKHMFEFVNIDLLTDMNNEEDSNHDIMSIVTDYEAEDNELENNERTWKGSYEWTIEPNTDFTNNLNRIRITSEYCIEGECRTREASSKEFFIVPPEVTLSCETGYNLIDGKCVRQEHGFNGYTFGTSDCDRIRILMQVDIPEDVREYKLYNIYWGENRLNTLDEMIGRCERHGFNMDEPITNGYYDWSEQLATNPAD